MDKETNESYQFCYPIKVAERSQKFKNKNNGILIFVDEGITLQQYFYFFEFQTAPFDIYLKQDFYHYDVGGHLHLVLIYWVFDRILDK